MKTIITTLLFTLGMIISCEDCPDQASIQTNDLNYPGIKYINQKINFNIPTPKTVNCELSSCRIIAESDCRVTLKSDTRFEFVITGKDWHVFYQVCCLPDDGSKPICDTGYIKGKAQ